MRIWDIPTQLLCRNHLLGEHRELHAIWTILTTGKKGYINHPETKRWKDKLTALYIRHEEEVIEMENRGFRHNSPLDKRLANEKHIQDDFINTIAEQEEILRKKSCKCLL